MSEKRPKPPVPVPVAADERGRYRVHPEWIGQATLINVGLIVLAIYLVTTLIGGGTPDIASKIALVPPVVSMPLLAILAMLLQLQESRRWASYPSYLTRLRPSPRGPALWDSAPRSGTSGGRRASR